jgi:hypothetical protein
VFALRAWDDKTIKAGLEPKRGKKAQRAEPAAEEEAAATAEAQATPAEDDDDEVLVTSDETDAPEAQDEHADEAADAHAEGEDAEVAAGVHAAHAHAGHAHAAHAAPAHAAHAPAAQAAPSQGRWARDEDAEPPGPDDVMRAEAAAGAAEMFDEEEDDDQPILGGPDDRGAPGAGEQADGRRRRRRRRRGGRTNGEGAPAPGSGGGNGAGGGGGLPTYTATPAFEARERRDSSPDGRGQDGRGQDGRGQGGREPREPREQRDGEVYRPQLIELTGGEGHALDDLAGRELSDAVAAILSTFDRNAGAVSLRAIAETAQRRGRLSGDVQLVQSQVAAAVRADNARRVTAGARPRFRLAGGRVALTDWLLSGDLARLEQEALAAVERYREAARRAFARKLGELPGHAFVEVCVLALEKTGVSQIRALRRAGVPGGESHFSGVLRAAATDELRVAIVIRRDGREVGRERVADLRGSLHHYGPANVGWIFTAGQMLSGAREEAAVPGVAPIALFDGLAVARLCEDNDVAVIRARLPIAIPDVDLLEALRAS